jgi:teichuronic acid exporter
MSLKKQALEGFFWTFIQQFGTQGINFLVSIILARLLLPEEFGLIGMITVLIGVGNIFINSGMSQSLLRTVDADEEDFSTIFFFNIIISIIVYLLIFLIAPTVAKFYNQVVLTSLIRIYTITFIINALSSIQIVRLSLRFNFKLQALITIPSILVSGLTGIFLAYVGYGVWSIVWSSILQAVLLAMQLWYFDNWVPLLTFNKNKFIKHWNFGSKLLLSGLLDNLFVNAYSVLIGKWFLPAEVGYYQRADSLKQFPVSNLSLVMNKVTYPLLASIQNDDQRLKNVYKQIMKMVIFVIAPTLIILAVLAEPLFRFLFTDKWLPAVPYFQILCANGVLYPIHAYNLNILNVKGRSDIFLKLELIKTFVLVAVIFISFQWGIYGLLYGTIFSSVIAFFINTYYTGKLIDYNSWEQIKDIFPAILLSIIAGFVVYFAGLLDIPLAKNDLSSLFIGIASGTLFFLFVAYIFKLEALKYIHQIIFRK